VSLKLFFVCVLFTLLALVKSGLFKNLLTTGVWMMILWLIIMLIGGIAKIISTGDVQIGKPAFTGAQKNVLTKLTTLRLLSMNLGVFKNLLTTGVWMMLLYLIIMMINGIVMINSTGHVRTGNMMVGGVQKNVLMKLTMLN